MQYQIPIPHPPIQDIPQKHPVSPPETAGGLRFIALQANRFLLGTTTPVSGPPQTFTPSPPCDVEKLNFAILHTNRYLVGTIPWLESLVPPAQALYPVSGPELARFQQAIWSQRFPAKPQYYEGPELQTYIFPVGQPEISRFIKEHANRYLVGTSPWQETLIVQQYIFPVSGPEFSRFQELTRLLRIVEPEKRFEAAVKPETFIFPVSQPEIGRYPKTYGLRYVVGPRRSTSGPGVFYRPLPILNQPEMSWFTRRNLIRYEPPAKDTPWYLILGGYGLRRAKAGASVSTLATCTVGPSSTAETSVSISDFSAEIEVS